MDLFKGYNTPGPYFERLCALFFKKKKATLDRSILWIQLEIVQGTQKSQFYFNRDHCCEVRVKQCVKINAFHVLIHKSVTP